MEESQDGTSYKNTIVIEMSLLLCLFGLFFVFDGPPFHTVLDMPAIRVSTSKEFFVVCKSTYFLTIFSS